MDLKGLGFFFSSFFVLEISIDLMVIGQVDAHFARPFKRL